jgi:hypothetical protein
VRWYPMTWRDRYGPELLEVLEQHDVTPRTVGNLLLPVGGAVPRCSTTRPMPAGSTVVRLRDLDNFPVRLGHGPSGSDWLTLAGKSQPDSEGHRVH